MVAPAEGEQKKIILIDDDLNAEALLDEGEEMRRRLGRCCARG